MKLFLPTVICALFLAGCSKSGNDPAPAQAPLVGIWTWSSQQTVLSPKNGSQPTVTNLAALPSVQTFTYDTNGLLSQAYNGLVIFKSNYTYNHPLIVVTNIGGSTTCVVKELTAHKLVYTMAREDATNRTLVIITCTR